MILFQLERFKAQYDYDVLCIHMNKEEIEHKELGKTMRTTSQFV
jgi:hypothetical protein